MHLGRLLPFKDREPNPEAVINPSMAQFQLWLAQAHRDHGNFSGRELERMEGVAQRLAQRSQTIFNPFTGEVRTLDDNGEVDNPTTVFLGGAF